MSGLNDDGSWPDWLPPPEAAQSHLDGYGHISRYVTPRLLDELGFGPGHRHEARRAGLDGPPRDRKTIQVLWEQLLAARIAYADPPWNPGGTQPIRDPEWLLRPSNRTAGTCIDLCLLFAGLCLNERLDTLLVMLRGRHKGHVLVVIRLGASAPDNRDKAKRRISHPVVPSGTDPTDTDGVWRVVDRESLLEDEDLLFLDATSAAQGEPGQTLGDGQTRALTQLGYGAYEQAHLVDIAVRQWACEDTPLPRPTYRGPPSASQLPTPPRDRGAAPHAAPLRPSLIARIQPPPPALYLFPSHDRPRAALHAITGKVVITGSHGTGKSTLAREAAAAAVGGVGWFLPAASRMAFHTALAEHELIERGDPVRQLEAVERDGLAREALNRLRRTEGRWVIVLDNANMGAAQFDAARYAVDRLPAPRDGQLIIATSTAGPDQWPGWVAVELPAVPAHEIGGSGRIARLCAGRPLLVAAFSRLLAAEPQALKTVLGEIDHKEADEAPDFPHAAAIYWDAAAAHLASPLTELAERLAWMPPDRIEPGAVGDDPEALAALSGVGLLGESASPGAASMHRAFGEAIKAAVTRAGHAERVVRELLDRPAVRISLLQHGDAEEIAAIATALTDTKSGMALWALASLQEVYQPVLSASTFARARALLDTNDPAQATALADCLHAAARAMNTRGRTTVADLAAAAQDLRLSLALRSPTDQEKIASNEALLALIRLRESAHIEDPAEKLLALTQARNLLEASWLRRRRIFADEDPRTDRGNYNRAGVRISIARVSAELASRAAAAGDTAEEARYRTSAASHLAEASQVYRMTLDIRRRCYSDPNPFTAASINGIAICGYESIRAGLADDPDALLSEAITTAVEALAMRQALGISRDLAKSASLLANLSQLGLERWT